MNHKKLWTYGLWIGVTQAVGILSGLLTKKGMDQVMALPKSSLTPPAIVFPIVWAILYVLMGLGAARIYRTEDSPNRTRGLWFFVFQLIFNFFWSLIYFNMHLFGVALVWILILWLLIGGMALNFYAVVPWTGLVQLPYLLWVGFASYLTYVTWTLNR